MALYHRDVYLPPVSLLFAGAKVVRYSAHALREASCDRYGNVTALLPKTLDVAACDIIEAETDKGEVTKVVVRVNVTATLDLVLALTADMTAKTVWAQEVTDTHGTLDRSRYARKVRFARYGFDGKAA